jgi:hypothetical protein
MPEMTSRQALAEILAIRIERFNREMVNPKYRMTKDEIRESLKRVIEYLDNDEIEL